MNSNSFYLDNTWPSNPPRPDDGPEPDCGWPLAAETRVPFIAWNRIQGVTRSENVDIALQARTYDPLWFLSRQWQFGEFKAENAGSVIKARVRYESTKPSGFTTDLQSNYMDISADEVIHLASKIQKLKSTLSIQQRSYLGSYFLKLVKAEGWDYATLLSAFCSSSQFGFEVHSALDASEWASSMDKVRLLADKKSNEACEMFQGKIPDGLKIYTAVKSNLTDINQHFSQLLGWETAKEKYIFFVESLYPHLAQSSSDDNWESGNMSSAFKIAYPIHTEGSLSQCRVLGAERLEDGRVDWYQMDVLANESQPNIDHSNYVSTQEFSIIPTAAKYRGMPSSRWWELEDASVELWKAGEELDETLKLIVAEYATVYSNNWMMIPFRRREMELINVEWVKVTDVFGEVSTILNALTQSESDVEPSNFDWNMFHHSLTDSNSNIINNIGGSSIHSSILLGSSRAVAASDEIEKVEFVRDEMDNRVWGIELKARDEYGNSRSGQELSDELRAYLEAYANTEETSFTGLHYKLAGTISEHYIPFVPMRTGLGEGAFENRQIALQRAWLPRYIKGNDESRIRPRTQLLRKGIAPNDTLIDGAPRFAIKEETIPRTGLTVSDRYYYARGVDGKIHLWLGRSSSLGSSASAGNLTFDQVSFKKQTQQTT
jgi:hypothetical protein